MALGTKLGVLASSTSGFANIYSLDFDGIDDYIGIGTTSLGITSAITVSAWVKIPTTNTGGPSPFIQEFICEDRAGGTNRNWGLFWRHLSVSDKFFRFQVWHTDGSVSFIESTGIVPNDGNWHHLMGTFDGTTDANGLKLYVSQSRSQSATSSMFPSNLQAVPSSKLPIEGATPEELLIPILPAVV